MLLVFGFLLAGCMVTIDVPQSLPQTETGTKSKAYQAVEDEGYTNIREDGTAIFGCSEDDSILVSRNITATNSNGKDVNLAVCCGLIFKGCTIRHK